MMGGPWGGGWGGWIFGPVIMLAFWAGLIVLGVWIVKSVWRSGETSHPSQSALDIARARYAQGEITREQFEQLKRDLGG